MISREAYDAFSQSQHERSVSEGGRLGKGVLLAQKIADAIAAPEIDKEDAQAEATRFYLEEIAA